MNGQVGIFMNNVHEQVVDLQFNIKLLAAFADERLLLCFAFFNLAADKFPQQSAHFMLRTLTNHEFFAVPYERGNNLGHYYFTALNHSRAIRAWPAIVGCVPSHMK